MKKLLFTLLLFACGIKFANATVIIDTSLNPLNPPADNQGWFTENRANTNPTNDNYITGLLGPDIYRSYFSFDLSGVVGTVTSVVLELRRYNQTTDLNLGFFDVSTPAEQLALRNVVRPDIFNDLGTGTDYGVFSVANGLSEDILSFELNSNAVSDINSFIGAGYFSIGAAVLGAGTIFSSSGGEPGNDGPGFTQRLVLNFDAVAEVPEPGTLLLLGLGLFAFGASRRKI